ncbi:TRAP transporter substrate-binding protein [uncultured Bilophila sp.]|uniref:TRAP transporter substrate-binding protein n=1 Tax=uncultured Bilophila sp. TaxID=529385 RepID=UPI0025928BF2|nr:TRAP transporter substrate-binding protein [uncultured Bilophila sp.]
MTVLYLDPETEKDSTQLEISVNCEGDACETCQDGFDPSTECTTCLAGYYGSDCKQCKPCNHGTCDDGLSGSGKCICDEGWGPDEVCNTCTEGYWGARCEQCPNCHGHGECLDGRTGTGKCDCQGNWDEINKRMIAESGNMAVGWLVQGFRVLSNSKRPINTIEDLKGLKIRVPNNPIMIATFRAWGGEPAPMAWDETFNALQQKVVDGQENPYPVFASNKFEEVQKYITEIHYKVWIGPIVVNAAWFKKQPADVQKAILEGGRLATENNRKMIAEMETDLVKVLKDKGVEILAKPEDEPVWQEKAMGVWPQFYDKIGDISLLDTMMKSLGRTRPQ